MKLRGSTPRRVLPFDGDLDEALKQELMQHLKDCHKCQVVFDTTRTTLDLYCDGKLYPLPDDVRSRLRQALERRRHEPMMT